MSINYTNLFTPIGECNKLALIYKGYITDLATYQQEFLDECQAQNHNELADGVPEVYSSLQAKITGWITNGLKSITTAILTRRATVTDNLPIGNVSGIAEVLPALRKDMVANSQTVKNCTITIGSPTYTVTNAGCLKLITTNKLDGYNAPATWAAANSDYRNVTSELAQDSQTLTAVCVGDSQTDGLGRGAETFIVNGNPAVGSYNRLAEGLGEANLTLGNAAGRALVANSGFETWLSNIPVSWTRNSGIAGTDFAQAAGGVQTSYALQIPVGTRTFDLSQVIPATGIHRNAGYALISMLKKAGTTGICTVTLEENASPLATNTMNVNTASSGWNVYSTVFFAGASLATDWTIRVASSASAFDGSPLVDEVFIVPVTYIGGIGMVLLAVDVLVLRGDKVAFSLSNDNAGKFQTYFRRQYGFQLPSTGSPSISDSLA